MDPMDEKREVTVTLPANKFFRVTSNDGGYKGEECIACGASDWVQHFKHEPDCQVLQQLQDTDLKKPAA